LRKERDFHRMHHKRVVQEKNKLLSDIKRLKKHYESYEPTLKQLRTRYEVAMKEKMLTKLERDRLAGKVAALESAAKQVDRIKDVGVESKEVTGYEEAFAKKEKEHIVLSSAPNATNEAKTQPRKNVGSKEPVLPMEDRVNPYASVELPSAKTDRFKQIHVVRAHDKAISG
jgi:uncharacterized protein (DUF3084 family)